MWYTLPATAVCTGLIVAGMAPAKAQQTITIEIVAPQDGDTIQHRERIAGSVTESNADVHVIIRPTEVSDYWVQPEPTVRSDGSWRVTIYAGRQGSVDVGKSFEIMAVANPDETLEEGDVLSGWPEAQGVSEVIEVIRE